MTTETLPVAAPVPLPWRASFARRQFVELEDLPACPRVLRDGATDYLELVARLGRVHEAVAPILARALSATGTRRIVDLCSGGGGPWASLLPALKAELGEEVSVCLTDLYPSGSAAERVRRIGTAGADLCRAPVDARRVPPSLAGLRTIFTGFHHFPPAEAVAILEDAVRQRQGIAIFELTARRARTLAAISLGPLLCLALMPLARPIRLSRLALTYLAPAIPAIVLWDGIVSCLRTYSIDEMRALARAAGAAGYSWEAGVMPLRRLPVPLTYLVGYPRPGGATP